MPVNEHGIMFFSDGGAGEGGPGGHGGDGGEPFLDAATGLAASVVGAASALTLF